MKWRQPFDDSPSNKWSHSALRKMGSDYSSVRAQAAEMAPSEAEKENRGRRRRGAKCEEDRCCGWTSKWIRLVGNRKKTWKLVKNGGNMACRRIGTSLVLGSTSELESSLRRFCEI